MIAIDTERCTGCGACVEACPGRALYLVAGKATVDQALCRECKACVAACAAGAITLTASSREREADTSHLPAVRPVPEVIHVSSQPAPVPFRSRAMPVVGAALAWAGREILPWLADLMLDRLDRRAAGRQVTEGAPGRSAVIRAGQGRGRQHRHRQRGGRESNI